MCVRNLAERLLRHWKHHGDMLFKQTNKQTRKTPPCMTATKPHIIPIMHRLLWALPVTEPGEDRAVRLSTTGLLGASAVFSPDQFDLVPLEARLIGCSIPAHCTSPASTLLSFTFWYLPAWWLVIPIQGQSCKPFSWRDRSREEISADGYGRGRR